MDKGITIAIGILAHVDAGKTSLTESMLYAAGATKDRGSVDKGSAITDALPMEKSRGISIKSSTVDFVWNGKYVTIVDTPGHVDFSAEVDRALSVLDIVILVVSAVEGIQAHTLNLWESLRERQLPVLVFVNKIDREGADVEGVFKDFEKDLIASLFSLNHAVAIGTEKPDIIPFQETQNYLSDYVLEKSLENLAEIDEEFLDNYFNGEFDDLTLICDKAISKIQLQKLVPVLFGSAKLDIGVQSLLHAITTLYPIKEKPQDSPTAKVFKIEYHEKSGRLAHVRLYGGNVRNKDSLWSRNLQKECKVNQIYQYKLGKMISTSELQRGEIGVVSVSDHLIAGDVLGESKDNIAYPKIIETVLSVQVVAKDGKDYAKLAEALEILNIEDPQLDFQWYKDEREFHLRILGPIQTEVLKDSLWRRFDIDVNILTPKVIYKETPKKEAQGYVRYWMPKPCWAIMTFLIKPGPLGSGVQFASKVRTSDISVKYQNEVKRAIPWALRQGIKGWEVTDIDITLVEGEEHQVHSNPGDFLLATPMGILRGIKLADTDLLEPIYTFEIKASQDLLGPISSDLNQMNATIDSPLFEDDFFTLSGKVSVDKAMNYNIKFNITTSGKGRLKLKLDGYQKTTVSDHKIRAFKGVSPLDESQWILHNRGAFKAEDRKR